MANSNTRAKILDLVQILTGVAVFIGLGLVVIELRQSHDLAEAQLVTDTYAEYFAFVRQQMGENPTPILTKGCLQPGELTQSEMATVMTIVDYRYDAIMRMRALERVGDFGIDWQSTARRNLQFILGTPIGMVDFQSFKNDPNRWDPQIVEIAEELIAKNELFSCSDLYEQWERGLRDLVGNES